jgi:hypothetical protein
LADPEELEEQWQEPEELGRQVVVYFVEEARSVGYYLCLKHPFRYQLPEGGRRGKISGRLSRKRVNGICVAVRVLVRKGKPLTMFSRNYTSIRQENDTEQVCLLEVIYSNSIFLLFSSG